MEHIEVLEISHLARRIEKLVMLCDTLRAENFKLNHELSLLKQTHQALNEKTNQARARIDSLLDKIKGMDTKDETREDRQNDHSN
jgi:uncharacterized protein (TIGR02449 family)